jgi:hypothetical protein
MNASLNNLSDVSDLKSNVTLASSSLLVNVDVNVWTATKQDKAVSNEVTVAKNASADSARVTKSLLSHSPQHKAVLNYRQTVYNWMQRITYEWAGAWRVLPMFRLEQFNREFEAHRVEFRKLCDALIVAYPALVSDAAFKHGALFDPTEYPDVEQLRNKFSIEKFVTVLPKDDFRVTVAEAVADDLKQQFQSRLDRVVTGIVGDMREQLITYATRLRNSCDEVRAEEDAEIKSGKAKRRKIYESTYDNVKSMVDLIKNFNLTDDVELREAAAQLEAVVSSHTLSDLRESAVRRADVKSDLDDILSKFAPINLA